MNDNISFLSNVIELSESKENENLVAKFCLCDFSTNENGVRLNRDTIENWVSTLVNQPLVGKIGRSGDFTGHNMRVKTVTTASGEKKKEVTFDTAAIGTFVSAGIEKIDNVECVVGTAEIWRRYPNICNLIAERVSEGTLNTSWEICVSEAHYDENKVKVIDDGRFTALCALGSKVPPAYACSRLLEVAETDEGDIEFEEAILMDFSNENNKEEKAMTENEVIVSEDFEVEISSEVDETPAEVSEVAEPAPAEEVESSEVSEPEVEEVSEAQEPEHEPVAETEVSSLTMEDLYAKVRKAIHEKDHDGGYIQYMFPEDHIVWYHSYCRECGELEYTQYTYTVNGEDVTVDDGVKIKLEASIIEMSQQIAEKNNALVEASTRIKALESEVAELKPYKDAADQAAVEQAAQERAEKVTALSEYATKSGFITAEEVANDEAIKQMISELDESGIKQVIAERFMASLNKEPEVEVSSATKTEAPAGALNLNDGESDTKINIVSAYINKK